MSLTLYLTLAMALVIFLSNTAYFTLEMKNSTIGQDLLLVSK